MPGNTTYVNKPGAKGALTARIRENVATEKHSCSLCGSFYLITFHHLIPKTCHNNKWFKKRFSRQEMINSGIYVCRRCHSFIHKKFDEKTLGRELNTLDKLRDNEVISKYVKWAGKRKNRV